MGTRKCLFYGKDIKPTDVYKQLGCDGYPKARCFGSKYGKSEECVLCAGAKQCKEEAKHVVEAIKE